MNHLRVPDAIRVPDSIGTQGLLELNGVHLGSLATRPQKWGEQGVLQRKLDCCYQRWGGGYRTNLYCNEHVQPLDKDPRYSSKTVLSVETFISPQLIFKSWLLKVGSYRLSAI